ncbi:hypothetical protein [Inquilinus limosus]|uniref:Uncharacterized protein n=1 Tax=Inquilinus limosus MP06 TaxID=1398085 RepID=A0A0A0DDA0_9PROT|nr:hypothetical protein [Inquilinus limosus]KGM36109.1 hypothetical protein P409_00210 [Inquilinus limosus MP06]
MDFDTLDEAEAQAARFLEKTDQLREELRRNHGNTWPITGTKETGAVRRASMDLTRALADLRRRPS